MARPSPYPAELRERAVRMVAEIRPNYPTEWAAMKAVAAKLGSGAAETVRTWVRKSQVDTSPNRRLESTHRASTDPGAVPSMSHRSLVGLSIACAALFLPVAACTSDHSDAKQPSSRSTRSSESGSAKTSATPSATRPPVQKAPELDDGERLAARRNVTTGSASIEFGKGRKSDALIVAVRCQGAGKIKVTVSSVHVSFPLECVADEVNTIDNRVAVTGVERSGVVSVEAPPGVRWSLTVGRGTAATPEG